MAIIKGSCRGVPSEVTNAKACSQILIGALCSGAALTVSSAYAYGQTMVKVDGIGLASRQQAMAGMKHSLMPIGTTSRTA
jgi:predicted porin